MLWAGLSEVHKGWDAATSGKQQQGTSTIPETAGARGRGHGQPEGGAVGRGGPDKSGNLLSMDCVSNAKLDLMSLESALLHFLYSLLYKQVKSSTLPMHRLNLPGAGLCLSVWDTILVYGSAVNAEWFL